MQTESDIWMFFMAARMQDLHTSVEKAAEDADVALQCHKLRFGDQWQPANDECQES